MYFSTILYYYIHVDKFHVFGIREIFKNFLQTVYIIALLSLKNLISVEYTISKEFLNYYLLLHTRKSTAHLRNRTRNQIRKTINTEANKTQLSLSLGNINHRKVARDARGSRSLQ